MEVSSNVSKIATIKAVREKLVALQQKMGQNGGVVMDGRDIGSVVFPDAELKFFITADPDIRAKRRYLEINDSSVSIEDIKANLKERDFIDTTREESPLIQVDDAILIDNSNLNQEEQLDLALTYVNRKLKFC
jgi:CMP/dCMP kinase